MAFKKTLVQRLFNLSRFSTPTFCRNPADKPPLTQPDPARLRRNSQRRPLYQSAMSTPAPASLRLFPRTAGENPVVETLRGMDIARDRIRLEGIAPLPAAENVAREEHAGVLTAREVRKVVRAWQVETIREKIKKIERDWISYGEYLEICEEICGRSGEKALGFAKMLDDSGSVIVLGNAVCLRPHLIANAIQTLITLPSSNLDDHGRRKELDQMEEQKAEIDQKVEALVRRELWAGLGYLVVQTAAFMRLTFWELSWDVMEPICFYVTSAYFMAGYAFFLRTSKEPSFEGFFQSRFSTKQKRLMNTLNFDLQRYYELRKAFNYPH